MSIVSSLRAVATATLLIGTIYPLTTTALAQDRPLPWANSEQRSFTPYDERRDADPNRFESRPLDPPPGSYGNSTYGSNQPYGGSSTYGNSTYGGSQSYGRPAPVPYGSPSSYQREDAYRAPPPRNDSYEPRYGGYSDRQSSYDRGYDQPAYGRSYEPPPPYRDDPPPRRYDDEPRDGSFSMREIRDAGHGFFGSVSQGLASVIEYAFKQKGRPNGYILGEDAGGAFVGGLRYGEGVMYTKDAGNHKIFWQGPSLGFDAGAEGSKVMVLVYNLRDPSDIYQRFGGVAGSAYVVGGVGLTFQSNNDIILAPIRSGIGLRLGANIGYLKYTRRPTWNPF